MNTQMQNRRSNEKQQDHRLTSLTFALCLVPFALVGSPAAGQSLPGSPSDLWREPVLPRGLGIVGNQSTPDSAGRCRGNRCRLFRMPSAFAGDPLGVESESESAVDYAAVTGGSGGDKDSTGDGRLQFAVGADNPYFDFRRPGDPGGVGFYKLHSQVLLFDSQTTGLSMGLQAVTPAGLEADGIADGPTILSPNFAWFHEVSNGTAIQGYVGKHLRANSRWSDSLERQIHYGLAVQSPFPGVVSTPSRSLHLFVEALGRYRLEGDPVQRSTLNWDLLPGIHWRLGESWWMSGGLLVPLGTTHLDSHLWQITCSWQF